MARGIAVAPDDEADWMSKAVLEAGARVVPLEEAEGLVWYGDAASLKGLLPRGQRIRWIQLPSAGVESYLPLMSDGRVWTAAKGVYGDACAEQALGLAIAGFRHLDASARNPTWHRAPAKTLFHARVTIVGAGGIAQSLIRLLQPFNATVTVVRRRADPVPDVASTVPSERLLDAIAGADLVVLATALTPQTEAMIARPQLRSMKGDAWLVNVARGRLVKTDDLVQALKDRWIGGAGLDVTDPEPLPDDHPLWRLDNCIITSHSANPPNLERGLFRVRIVENVSRFLNGQPLLGVVDRVSGY